MNLSGSPCARPSEIIVSGDDQSAIDSGLFSSEMSNFEFGNSIQESAPVSKPGKESKYFHPEESFFHRLILGGSFE